MNRFLCLFTTYLFWYPLSSMFLYIPNYLSGPPRVSQSGVELENFFECGFMASDDAYGSYKTYGKVRLKFGPL